LSVFFCVRYCNPTVLKYLDTAMYDGEINQVLGARSVSVPLVAML
jgi:hypothetical protein